MRRFDNPLSRIAPDLAALEDRRRERAATPHHHDAFQAEERSIEPGVDPDQLRARLESWDALRIKGWVETSAGLFLVQGVGPRIELAPVETAPEELLGRLVVIRRVLS